MLLFSGKVASSVRFLVKNFAGVAVACEIKYDGMRAQIHLLPDGTLKVFSRHLEVYLAFVDMFP